MKHKIHLVNGKGTTECGWAFGDSRQVMVWNPAKGVPSDPRKLVCEKCKLSVQGVK